VEVLSELGLHASLLQRGVVVACDDMARSQELIKRTGANAQ
jgi:hypothetical protein